MFQSWIYPHVNLLPLINILYLNVHCSLLQLKKWAWKTHKLVNLFLAWVPIPKSVQMLQSSHPWPWNFLFFHELSAFVWQISYKSRNTNTPTKFQNWYLDLLLSLTPIFPTSLKENGLTTTTIESLHALKYWGHYDCLVLILDLISHTTHASCHSFWKGLLLWPPPCASSNCLPKCSHKCLRRRRFVH